MNEYSSVPQTPPKHPIGAFVSLSFLGLVLGLAFFFFDPATQGMFWRCPFNAITGLDCPGCGGQRALHALLHVRFMEALHFNMPAVLLFFPAAAYAYLAYAINVTTGKRLPMPEFTLVRLAILVGILIIYGILRNIL